MYPVNSGYVMTQVCQIQLSDEQQVRQPQALYGTSTSRYQPQRIDMPPAYKEGQYVTQQNQQV